MSKPKVIFLSDAEAFYASVEKSENPEYKNKPLVVAGSIERRSGIVLAACPIAKSFGITTEQRLGEAVARCPELVVVQPRMQRYIDVSMTINRIYQSYTDLVEIFSVDESFLDLSGSLHLFGTPQEIAKRIQTQVKAETGVYVRIGISSNKVLAKMANNYAKKEEEGIYTLMPDQLKDTLWTLPIDKMYMVGSRMTQHFKSMGLYTIGDVANTPIDKLKSMMRSRMGKQSDLNAQMYFNIANGIDYSLVTPETHSGVPKSISSGTTLPKDYKYIDEIRIILLEQAERVCQRARMQGYMGHVVSVDCIGADYDFPSGFSRREKMVDPTNITNQVYHAAVTLFLKHWNGQPVRKIGVGLSELSSDKEYQISIFDTKREKLMALEKVTDTIKHKYGEATILRAASIVPSGQALHHAQKIGGHYK